VALPELTPQLALPEEAVTVLFCRVDDVYYRINPQGRRYETRKELSVSEVVTLALFQQLRGVESERSFLREAAHIRPLGAPHNGPELHVPQLFKAVSNVFVGAEQRPGAERAAETGEALQTASTHTELRTAGPL
jgi:hypothetical protein